MLFSKKSVLTLGLGLACSSLSFSQTSTPIGAAAQMNLNTLASKGINSAGVIAFDNRYEGMKGSPYYQDGFVSGLIELKVGNTGKTEVYKGVKLKYDVYSNLLVAVLPDSKDTLQITTTPLLSFSLENPLNGKLTTFKRVKEAQALDANLGDTFFAILHESPDGKSTLVKRVYKNKIEANYKGGYSAGTTYDELVSETQYYVVTNGKMQKIKLNKKSLGEAFPAHADKVKSYISSQKLSMSTEADLVNVMAYVQTL
jgi:hypothetical protein